MAHKASRTFVGSREDVPCPVCGSMFTPWFPSNRRMRRLYCSARCAGLVGGRTNAARYPIAPEQYRQMVDLMQTLPFNEIARRLNLTSTRVKSQARRLGIRSAFVRANEERRERLAALAPHSTVQQLAETTGMSDAMIRYYLRRYHIPVLPAPPRPRKRLYPRLYLSLDGNTTDALLTHFGGDVAAARQFLISTTQSAVTLPER